MGLLGGGKRSRTLRRATERLLQEPTEAMALRAWYVHGANWLLGEFGQRAHAESSDKARVDAVKRGLANAEQAPRLVRVGAWSLASRCLLSTGDAELFDVFKSDFGVGSEEEARIVEFVPEGHEGDDVRLARTSLESLVLAGGAELPPGGYKDNAPLLLFWAESVSTCLIHSKRFVDNVIDQLGLDAAENVLRYAPE